MLDRIWPTSLSSSVLSLKYPLFTVICQLKSQCFTTSPRAAQPPYFYPYLHLYKQCYYSLNWRLGFISLEDRIIFDKKQSLANIVIVINLLFIFGARFHFILELYSWIEFYNLSCNDWQGVFKKQNQKGANNKMKTI